MKPATVLLPIALLALAGGALRSEPTSDPLPPVPMSFAAFMREVGASNLDYAAQRYNVSIAEAQLAIARVFLPNPQIQLGYASDVTPGRPASERESAVTNGGFTQTIEIGGQRSARVDSARHTLRAASAGLDDFLRNLRSTAASAFIDARVKRMIAERMRQSAEAFDRVVQINAQRLKVGDVGEIDATQARLDALQFHSQYLSAESDAESAVIALSQLMGRAWAGRAIQPEAQLDIPAWTYDMDALMTTALDQRPDVRAAREARDAAAAAVRLAKAKRIPDLGLGLNYTRTGASNNPVAPYEKTDSLGASLSVELPVFTQYQHDLESARYGERQAEKQYDAALLKAQIDIRQAFAAYRLAVQQLAQYRDRGALRDAETVLRARSFSYEHGAASLLDLLQAQRDFNDVYLNYYNALSSHAKARVSLEQAAGIWEIDF